jgi:hypothetical protein
MEVTEVQVGEMESHGNLSSMLKRYLVGVRDRKGRGIRRSEGRRTGGLQEGLTAFM